MSLLQKNKCIIDLGHEDIDSGELDSTTPIQSTSYSVGAGGIEGPSHTTKWSRKHPRRKVKVSEISAKQWAELKSFWAKNHHESFTFTDDNGVSSTAQIDEEPEATCLGEKIIDGVGKTKAYSLILWIDIDPNQNVA